MAEEKEPHSVLGTGTKISLGVMGTILTMVMGYSDLKAEVRGHSEDITELKGALVEYTRIAQKLDRRLYRLEIEAGLKDAEPPEKKREE